MTCAIGMKVYVTVVTGKGPFIIYGNQGGGGEVIRSHHAEIFPPLKVCTLKFCPTRHFIR